MGIFSKIKSAISSVRERASNIGTTLATGGQSTSSTGSTSLGMGTRGPTSTSGGGASIGGVTIVPSASPDGVVKTGGIGGGGTTKVYYTSGGGGGGSAPSGLGGGGGSAPSGLGGGGVSTLGGTSGGGKTYDWGGKVENVGTGETKYYQKGKEVGRTFRGEKGEYFSEVKPDVKKASFVFDYTKEGRGREEVELTPEGGKINVYEAIMEKGFGGGQPILTEEIYTPPTFWESPTAGLRQKQMVLETGFARGDATFGKRVKSFGLGVGVVGLGVLEFGKNLFTQPVRTIKSIPSGFVMEAKSIGAGLQSPYPEFALGKVGGYVAMAKIPEATLKVSDIFRTAGKTELLSTDIIAPEYFRGQTYPKISRGETAGQLLKEFKGTRETYGVTQLRGFTASQGTFKSETLVAMGGSEIAGLYQAPKLSPAFLKIIEGEKVLFSLKPFGTFKPTALLTKPKAYELTPFVKYSQRGMASISPRLMKFFGGGNVPLKFAEKYFPKDISQIYTLRGKKYATIDLGKPQAPLGKSYIPFMKSEKEALIPMGTPLQLKESRFFFKFEGRKIPILEFEIGDLSKVIGKPIKEFKVGETYSAKGLLEYSKSYGRTGKRSYTSPYDIFKVSRSYGYSTSSYLSSVKSSLSSMKSSLSSYKPSVSSKGYGSYSRGYRGSFRSYTGGRSYGYGGGGSSYGFPPFTPPPTFPRKPKLPKAYLIEPANWLRAEREFKWTPSLAPILRFELTGIKKPRVSKGMEYTGLSERELGIKKMKKINIPNLTGKVTKFKLPKEKPFKKKKKRSWNLI